MQFYKDKKDSVLLSAFLVENWQTQKIGRELVFSADLCYNGSSKKAFLQEEGGARSVTEGACVTLGLDKLYCNALSLSRPRQAAGANSLPEGALILC